MSIICRKNIHLVFYITQDGYYSLSLEQDEKTGLSTMKGMYQTVLRYPSFEESFDLHEQ